MQVIALWLWLLLLLALGGDASSLHEPPSGVLSAESQHHSINYLSYDATNTRYRRSGVMMYVPASGWSLWLSCVVTGNRTLLCQSVQKFTQTELRSCRLKLMPDRIDAGRKGLSEHRVVRASRILHELGPFYEDDLLWRVVLDRDLLLANQSSPSSLVPVTMHSPQWRGHQVTVGGPNFRCGIHYASYQRVELSTKYFDTYTLSMDSSQCPPAPIGNFVFEETIGGSPRLLGLMHGLANETTPGLVWEFEFALFEHRLWLTADS